MNLENPQEKIRIKEGEKDIIVAVLASIAEVLEGVENGDENYAYADTGDSMETLDSLLAEDQVYKKTIPERKEASMKCMRGSEIEKKEGLKQVKTWVEKVRNLI